MMHTAINTIEDFDKKTSRTHDGSLINYSFKDIDFKIKLELKDANIIRFENCIFKEEVKFPYSVNQNALVTNCIFEEKVSFHNSTFNEKVRFYATQFKGETNFNNTKFKNLADFWNAKFYKPTIFYKTDFLGTTVFSSTVFSENVLFTYSLIEKLVIFRGTNFEKGLDLSLAIIPGTMSIFDINITDFEVIDDPSDTHEFSENVSETGKITRKNKRETFRIFKNQLFSNQNSIDALTFSSLEMSAYSKQLDQNVFIDKNKNAIPNWLLLKLNKYSSKYGISWLQGVAFTLSVALFFFLLINYGNRQL